MIPRSLCRLSSVMASLGAIWLGAVPLSAQRRSPAADVVPRAAIDSFVITVRDMAAWALVTPSAHVPVGALQDATGEVESVVGAQGPWAIITPDSALLSFRQALGAGARARRSDAIGLAYFRRVAPPGRTAPVEVLVVEVEHRSGYRATVVFPYDTSGEMPEFREPFMQPAVLAELGAGANAAAKKKSGATRRRPRSANDDPR